MIKTFTITAIITTTVCRKENSIYLDITKDISENNVTINFILR